MHERFSALSAQLAEQAARLDAHSLRLEQYAYIMQYVRTADVSQDQTFQRTYNGFYRVRRNEAWRTIYFRLFEDSKRQPDTTFAYLLSALYEQTGNVEPSFSSKMLATLDPRQPIWDSHVLENLGLTWRPGRSQSRLQQALELYADIQQWYTTFLSISATRACIAAFDQALPQYRWLSDVKKIDCILWSIH